MVLSNVFCNFAGRKPARRLTVGRSCRCRQEQEAGHHTFFEQRNDIKIIQTMMRKHIWFLTILLAIAQQAWAWEGSGTQTDPYKIQTSADWKQLSNEVVGGSSFSGLFFEMTADIDAEGISVGSESKHFSGTFDGGGHTLTYNRGASNQPVNELCAPFISLD
jgi:hypothetical protein